MSLSPGAVVETLAKTQVSPRRRIALVISSLRPGGAERVMSRMANHWAAAGSEVVIITTFPRAHDHYELHPAVGRVAIGMGGASNGIAQALLNNRKHVQRLRREIQLVGADVVISFGDSVNVLTLLATVGLDVPVVVSERTNPTRPGMSRIWSAIRRVTYPQAAGVVVQSGAVADWARNVVPEVRIHTIPNPVQVEGISASTSGVDGVRLVGTTTVIAVGRLSHEKGFDLLIDAFARIWPDHRSWNLVIIGEGVDREKLEAQVQRLGLEGIVHLPGKVARPEEFLRRAGLFVLPSRIEGFPNALLEAMACGLPVVAADCPYGPADIVRSGWDGLLVPADDSEALAKAMQRLLAAPEERAALATRATGIAERFSLAKVMGQWDDVVAGVCRRQIAGLR